jgi:hypothetical protein
MADECEQHDRKAAHQKQAASLVPMMRRLRSIA